MTNTHDVINRYISILESELTDPNSQRRNSNLKWIYDDIPYSTSGAKYPRISVLSFGNPVEAHEVGTTRQRVTCRIEIQIRVKRTKWNDKNPQTFLDEIALDVIDSIRKESSREALLTNESVFHTQLEAENNIYSDDLIIKQLVYKNIFVR